MFKFLERQRKPNAETLLGVAFRGGGLSLALLDAPSADHLPRLRAVHRIEESDPEALGESLKALVQRLQLQEHGVTGVLAPDEYQIFQVAEPNVPESELRQAARWVVRDLIDFPVDHAVIDTFSPPDSAQRSTRTVNVVVTRQTVVDAHVAVLEGADLSVAALDIPDLVQRNLCERLPDGGTGIALLALGARTGLLNVCRNGEQFLARHMNIGCSHLQSESQSVYENLLLDVQRSLDYVEGTLNQPPIRALHCYPFVAEMERFLELARDTLNDVDCTTLGLGDLVEVAADARPGEHGLGGLHAVGAALRNTVSAP